MGKKNIKIEYCLLITFVWLFQKNFFSLCTVKPLNCQIGTPRGTPRKIFIQKKSQAKFILEPSMKY